MNYQLIIFDADGTLRYCTVQGQPCPNRSGEWKLYPDVVKTLERFKWMHPGEKSGVGYGIASNQGGVDAGYFSESTAMALLKDTFREAFGFDPAGGTVEMCTHVPHEDSDCRKPEPAMLNRIMRLYKVSPDRVLFVGDRDADRLTALNAGCDFQWAGDFFNRSAETY